MTNAHTDNWQWLELEAYPKRTDWAVSDKKRVLLVAVNMPGYYSLPVRILSLMAAQDDELSAYFDIRYVETDNRDPVEPLLDTLDAWQPDIVAFSVNIWNREQCIAVSDALRSRHPEVTILGGGQEVSYSVYDFLAIAPAFDYLIDGEGELPFLQFLNAWHASGRTLSTPQSVSGLHYRVGPTTAFTRPAEVVDNLDEIPSPILAGLVPVKRRNLLGVMLEGARGCPFHCAFCFEGTKKPQVRMASIERLNAEVEQMTGRGARFFHIMDAILCNSEIERLRKLKEIFVRAREKNPSSVVLVEAYADRITDEVADNMDAFSIIDLGLQTTNPETARAIHRPFNQEKYRQGLEPLRKTGSTFNIYLICGLPHETLNSFLRGIQFVLEQRPTRLFINELCLLNGTELRRKADEYGYQYDPKPPYIVTASAWMSPLELKFTQVVSKVIERYYNLTVRSIFAAAPWLPKQVNTAGTGGRLILPGGCSYTCAGCRNAESTAEDKIQGLETLKHATDCDVDILAGDSLAMDRSLMQVSGQLQLCGSARNRLVAPLSAFADPTILEKLIQRGFWHYKTFCTASGAPKGVPGQDNAAQAGHFNRSFELAGNASFNPFLEVVLHPGSSTSEQYCAEILKLATQKVTTISVPEQTEELGEAWQIALVETFWQAMELRTWINLPEKTLKRALTTREMGDIDETLGYLDTFNMVSREQEQPACFNPVTD